MSRYINSYGKVIPSVTQITGLINKPALINWAYKQGLAGKDLYNTEERKIGEDTHKLIMNYLRGEQPEDITDDITDDRIKTTFSNFLRWYENNNKNNILMIEKPLSNDLFGGTPDLVVSNDRGITVIDFKTGKIYEEHYYQVAGYGVLLRHLGLNTRRGRLVSFSRENDEIVDIDVEIGKGSSNEKIFKILYNLYKELNK